MTTYREEVINKDTTLANAGSIITKNSFDNCPTCEVMPAPQRIFRGSPSFQWKKHILQLILKEKMSMVSINAMAVTKNRNSMHLLRLNQLLQEWPEIYACKRCSVDLGTR